MKKSTTNNKLIAFLMINDVEVEFKVNDYTNEVYAIYEDNEYVDDYFEAIRGVRDIYINFTDFSNAEKYVRNNIKKLKDKVRVK